MSLGLTDRLRTRRKKRRGWQCSQISLILKPKSWCSFPQFRILVWVGRIGIGSVQTFLIICLWWKTHFIRVNGTEVLPSSQHIHWTESTMSIFSRFKTPSAPQQSLEIFEHITEDNPKRSIKYLVENCNTKKISDVNFFWLGAIKEISEPKWIQQLVRLFQILQEQNIAKSFQRDSTQTGNGKCDQNNTWY